MIFHPSMREYYAPGDDYDVGLWLPGITSQHEASEALFGRMSDALVRAGKTGRVLDAAPRGSWPGRRRRLRRFVKRGLMSVEACTADSRDSSITPEQLVLSRM